MLSAQPTQTCVRFSVQLSLRMQHLTRVCVCCGGCTRPCVELLGRDVSLGGVDLLYCLEVVVNGSLVSSVHPKLCAKR